MMWGNLGSINEIDKAVPHVDLASSSWELVLHGIANAYHRNGRDMKALATKLHEFEGLLEDLASRLALHMMLGDHYYHQNEIAKCAEYFEKVIASEGPPFHVKRARGMLREISELGEGNIAPDFEAETLEGDKIKLDSLKGKVVLLDFWASTCGPCLPELGHIKNLSKAYDEKDLVIIGISKDMDLGKLQEAIKIHQLTWPQVWQPMQTQSEVPQLGHLFELYNVYGIPNTYLIDGTGNIVKKGLRGRELERAVEDLVGKERG